MSRAMMLARVAPSAVFLALFLIGKSAHADDQSPPPPQQTILVPPPEDTRPRVTSKLEYDHVFSNLYGLSIPENGLRLGVGAQTHRLTAYATVEFALGSTPDGLGTVFYSGGIELQYRALPFLRLGGGARLDMMLINRATTGEAMGALGYGFFASVDFDVIRFGPREDHGVFIGARMNVDLFAENESGPTPIKYGPELRAGFRF